MSKCLKLFNIIHRARPFVFVFSNRRLLHSLIDTGANIPIFTLGEEELFDYFPNAKLDNNYNVKLTGIGKGAISANLYNIDELTLQSGSDKIVFKNFKLACCDKPELEISLILPGGLFEEMNLMFMSLVSPAKQVWIEHEYGIYYGDVELGESGNLLRVFAKSKPI